MNDSAGTAAGDSQLRTARALARVLDSAVGIPGTRFRVGLDAILGLIPGGGDVAAAALSGYIVLTAARRGVPKAVIARMLVNVAADTAIGAIPVLGDLFDVAFKANQRNVALLEQHDREPRAVHRRSRGVVAAAIAGIALIVVGAGVVAFLVARLIWGLLAA